MFEVVKSVFLPWYNAFRFFLQSVERIEVGKLGIVLATMTLCSKAFAVVVVLCVFAAQRREVQPPDVHCCVWQGQRDGQMDLGK